MTRGELLFQLQNLDLETEQSQRRIAEIQKCLGETDALLLAREAVGAAQEEQKKRANHTRNLELEIESLNHKITLSETRLYSGRVINPKELTDIQEEVASLKRRRARLEDQLLEAMLAGEEAEDALATCRDVLLRKEAEWQAEQTALKEEAGRLETRVQEMQKEREQVRRTATADALALYDKVRSRCGSIAVTALRDGVCGFCAVAPSSTKLRAILSGRELLLCGNCGRILLHL